MLASRAKIRIGTYNTNYLFERIDNPYNYCDNPWRGKFATKPKKLEFYDLGARFGKTKMEILSLQEALSVNTLREFSVCDWQATFTAPIVRGEQLCIQRE